MLSTETADLQVDEALRLGANDFIFKPVTIEELERAVGNVLSQG
jgi:PleD family two-component response regulator